VIEQPAELELLGVHKRFGSVMALQGATFTVRPSSIHALLGENGAGKTSLMRIAYGLLQPDGGTLRVRGHDVVIRSPRQALQLGIGMVQQHFSLVPQLTAVENFALGSRGRLHLRRERARLAEAAARLDFFVVPDVPVAMMSPAEQQQLELLKAIANGGRILILDEPTAVLPPQQAAALLQLLRDLARRGMAIVLITHKLRDALSTADEVSVLRDGRTVLTAAIAELDREALVQAMLGESRLPAASPVARARSDTVSSMRVARLRDVSVHDPGGRDVLHNVTLDVHAGETIGVAGLERSGHRLLLRVLAGRQPVTSGAIELASEIGFVPEDRHRAALALDLSARDNVAMRDAGRRRGWFDAAYWDARTREVMALFDVRPRDPTLRVRALSGGNQQRLVLGRALTPRPDLVVVENPTHGLDTAAADEVLDRLRSARAAGSAVILYSSDLDELASECDRVLAVHEGVVRPVESRRDAIGRAMLGHSS
jgi:general nucleoside transport system ATP-binding protein